MKIVNKLLYLLSISVILFSLTTFVYDINCMGENQKGYGHFFVWIIKGYSSLSYQIDVFKLIFDFFIFSIIIFLLMYYIKNTSRWLSIILYCISSLIILIITFCFFILELYFEKINCETIFSSISFVW